MTVQTIATEDTLALITRFEKNFSPLDVDAVMADMTEDCVFEHIAPAAVSLGRHEGQAAVRAVWESLESHFPGYTLEADDIFTAGNRAVARWTIRHPLPDGTMNIVRGVDDYTVRDGKIAEKLVYATL